ncbi:MAG: cytochrome c peroxidase [Sphingomonadaceae bacterium]|nr:hypothetical protein [Sphingomonadaceae bacterium]
MMAMIWRHRGFAAAGTLALAFALTGCGGDGSATPTNTNTTQTPTPTPPASTNAADNAVIQQFLRLDLNSLANYAAPALPAYYDSTLDSLDNTPANDPVDDAIATLGQVLFFDKALSVNNTTSCATCHQQALGFDDNEQFSTGFSGSAFTAAHAMRLGNIRYYQPGEMFWDRRAASVEDQATQPILNPVEMGWQDSGGIPALIAKMQGLNYYPVLFRFAYGDEAITEARIERALAHFERAMISADSRWDRAYAQVFNPNAPNRALNAAFPGFTTSEERGKQLFMTPPNAGGAGCAACHVPPTFTLAANSRSNGLDAGETTVFKAPSLKSVSRSQFFMHDGRFTSLEQVVSFYNSGVQDGPALDNRLRQGNAPQQLNLSAADQQALVDFLLTLDDATLASDTRFSDPFIN